MTLIVAIVLGDALSPLLGLALFGAYAVIVIAVLRWPGSGWGRHPR